MSRCTCVYRLLYIRSIIPCYQVQRPSTVVYSNHDIDMRQHERAAGFDIGFMLFYVAVHG